MIRYSTVLAALVLLGLGLWGIVSLNKVFYSSLATAPNVDEDGVPDFPWSVSPSDEELFVTTSSREAAMKEVLFYIASPPRSADLYSETASTTTVVVENAERDLLKLDSDLVAIKQVLEYRRAKALQEHATKKGWDKRAPRKPEDAPLYQEWQQVEQVGLPMSPPKL